jgi:hypothetical protein
MRSSEERESRRELDDPLNLTEHVLRVLRSDVDRDAAIERLIRELEDQRALLIASRLARLPRGRAS